jgi:O-antigen ligase
MLTVGMIGIGFCLSLKLRRTGFVLVFIAAALLLAAAASSAVIGTAYNDYILKGNDQESGVLHSRRDVWAKSYENAEAGGWVGVGYGVTVGDTAFQGGLTSVGYGREKGNAQLAIIEETGLVGLSLYLFVLLTLFTRLIAAHMREKNSDLKVALGIITGSLAGFTVMSFFEAWWVSPGSPESAYFWSLAGVGLGLAQSTAYGSKWAPSYIVQRPAVYPAGFPPQRVKG